MSIFGNTLASAAAFAVVVSAAGASHAQGGYQSGGYQSGGYQAGGYQAQINALHDSLHLTSAQEDGWRAYQAAIAPDPGAQARQRETARMIPGLPTPRRVDLINATVDADAAAVHRQGAAVKAFYASLTPDQQRTFDRQTAMQPGGQQQPSQGGPPLGRPGSSNLPPPQ